MATTTSPTSTQLMTWEEFERLPSGDGYHRELLRGVLQVLPPPKSGHSKIALRVLEQLLQIRDSANGSVFAEAGYKLSDNPPHWVQPDVSFLSKDRQAGVQNDDYFRGAPDLAVEVISPSESASDIDEKVESLLSNGAKAVWVIYPGTRKVHVFALDGSVEKKGIGDKLTAPFLKKDWSLEVETLFGE